MSLFTATGILMGSTRGLTRGILSDPHYYAIYSYDDWYRTQTEAYPLSGVRHYSWLVNLPEMFARRAPGNTCLITLSDPEYGTIEKPINDSKGCGGVMRVAPVGLFYSDAKGDHADNNEYIKNVNRAGAEVAAFTHGHPLGYIPAAALTHIISLLAHSDITVKEAMEDMLKVIPQLFSADEYMSQFLQIMNKAVELSENENISDLEAIRQLGEGWVAEETLAIAVYCVLKYSEDFEKGIIASVNHGGDSDSTGSVTGNILGTHLGLKGIPQKFLDNLELKDVILEIADDLYTACEPAATDFYSDPVWEQKYLHMTYPNGEE